MLAGLTLSACATHFVEPAQEGPTQLGRVHVARERYYFWGFRGERSQDIRDWCGMQGMASAEIATTPSDAALTLVTLGIYSPRHVRVTCRDGVETSP